MSYLATIAKETAWSMSFILWELPYCTGLGLIHAAGIRRGVAMELVNGPAEEGQPDGLREAFEAMKNQFAAR